MWKTGHDVAQQHFVDWTDTGRYDVREGSSTMDDQLPDKTTHQGINSFLNRII